MQDTLLAVVVPCFNEEEALKATNHELCRMIDRMIDRKLISVNSYILYVDDGSRDTTWALIEHLTKEYKIVRGLKLSRNFGHQNALLAGLEISVQADCTITIDADLQDDVTKMQDFVEKYHQGYEIVYGVRDNRDSDQLFKRKTAGLFYSLMGKFGTDLIPNHADYRLLSQRALQTLLTFKEKNLFFRGLIPLVGFPATKVYYARSERTAGESKYPLKKMLAFALNGITSFSVTPLRLVFYLSFIVMFTGILMLFYTFLQKARGNVVAGWSSLMVSIWVIGGLQLFCIGIVGEYIGRIFSEVKSRPRYIVEKKVGDWKNDEKKKS